MSKHRSSSSAPRGGGDHPLRIPEYPTGHQRSQRATDVKHPADAQQPRGRTQWDAMAEVTNDGKWRATKMALLIFVRYAPRSALGAVLVEAAMRLIEAVSHHH